MPKHGKNAVFADAGETLNPLNAKHLEIDTLTGGQKVAGSNPVTPIDLSRQKTGKIETFRRFRTVKKTA
jgi:hypothetical protein